MLPSIEIRIQNLIKAMQQVVLPAVSADNKLAQEQAQLVISHLQMLGLHWDKAHQFERSSFEAMRQLAEKLCKFSVGGARTTIVAQALSRAIEDSMAMPASTAPQIAKAITVLGTAVDSLILAISEDADSQSRRLTQALILDYAKLQARRERTWFASNALDPDHGELSTIEAMLESTP